MCVCVVNINAFVGNTDYFYIVSSFNSACKSTDVPLIRKADVENHNRDGGLWIVYNGKVYDIQDRYIF